MVLSTARIEIAMDSGDLLHRLGYSIFYPRPPSSAVVPNEKQLRDEREKDKRSVCDRFDTRTSPCFPFNTVCYGATSSFRR
eukprot:scaffold60696_cov41-Attheya_sp.AAC.2